MCYRFYVSSLVLRIEPRRSKFECYKSNKQQSTITTITPENTDVCIYFICIFATISLLPPCCPKLLTTFTTDNSLPTIYLASAMFPYSMAVLSFP